MANRQEHLTAAPPRHHAERDEYGYVGRDRLKHNLRVFLFLCDVDRHSASDAAGEDFVEVAGEVL